MKMDKLISWRDDLEQDRARDPEFRQLWDSTAFARAVAIEVVRYRTEHNLTQAEFAGLVGMTQPAVARLESGEETPTLKTLTKVTNTTGLEFHLAVTRGTVTITSAAA